MAAAGIAVAAVLLWAPSALASTVSGGPIITAGPGEINDITVTESGGDFVITDTAGVTAQGSCMQDTLNQATCIGGGVIGTPSLTVDAGDMDDRVTLRIGSPLGAHGAHVSGGSGNDTIDASQIGRAHV